MSAETTGHVKHNPETGAVAVRTAFDRDQFPNMVWLIASVSNGAQNARDTDVEGWDDLFVPAPPEPEAVPNPPAPEPEPIPTEPDPIPELP